LIFPPDGAAVRVEALGPGSRGLVLAATGENLSWYVGGEALPIDPVARRPVWRPASEGFYEVVAVDAEGREARARVRIRR
jgi:penicillin-binding protein 1C